jgi:protein ImuB
MFVCAYIPDFAVQAALLASGQHRYDEVAAVVVNGPLNLLRIIGLNDLARQAGLQVGMTKLQAEVCGGVVIKQRAAEEEEAAQAALLACAGKTAPRVESTALGVVILDVRGMERIFLPLHKAAWAMERAVMQFGFRAQVAMAVNSDAAMHIAIGRPGVTIAAAGEEGEWLGELPVEVLSPNEEIALVLTQWGIRTCKDLALLPRKELAARLGQEGLRLQRLARGESTREFVPYEPEMQFAERYEAEEPLGLLPELMEVISNSLTRVMVRLLQNALAVEKVELACELDVHAERDVRRGLKVLTPSRHEFAIAVPEPTQDTQALLKLIELELEARPPAAAVKKVRLTATPAKPRATQAGLFSVLTPEPEKLEITLTRLREEVGADRVGTPLLSDTDQPDSFAMEKFTGAPAALYAEPQRQTQFCLRRFRPPVSARVRMRAQGTPESVTFQGETWAVRVASGPWRLSGTWWRRADAWIRNGWHLALDSPEGTGVYSVFQDGKTQAWFVEGRFD